MQARSLVSEFRLTSDPYQADGSQIAPGLQAAIDILKMIPFEDSTQERPHSCASRVKVASPGCRWDWVAATVRLEQNLEVAKKVGGERGFSWSEEWRAWRLTAAASLLQLPANLLRRCGARL